MTFARVDTDAIRVPVLLYADIVDRRPRVVGQAGGITIATEQLIALLGTDAVDEKFKNSALLPVEATVVPPIAVLSLLQVIKDDAAIAKPSIPKITIPLIDMKPNGDIGVKETCKCAKLAPNNTSLNSSIPRDNVIWRPKRQNIFELTSVRAKQKHKNEGKMTHRK
jgi:hypothetical protein